MFINPKPITREDALLISKNNFLVQLRYEGVRVRVSDEGGSVNIYDVYETNITDCFSEIVKSIRKCKGDIVFDGIISFLEGEHKLVLIDLPEDTGTLIGRVHRLWQWFDELQNTLHNGLLTNVVYPKEFTSAKEGIEFVEEHGLSGLVFKQKDSFYESGDSDVWMEWVRDG